ncbi:MAG: DUF1116 domain-containing protein [Nitrososphaeraceae archaeon]|jgi:hypothetical protein
MNDEAGIRKHIEEANNKALELMRLSRPILVDIKCAKDILPKMKKNSIFHAGPPIDWNRMCGPMRGAIVGTMIFEGFATSWNDALELIRKGGIDFSSNHDHDAVGPMAGVISPSLPILVVKDRSNGKTCYARFVENRVQFGLFDQESVKVLRYWSEKLSPPLGKAIRKSKGIDLKPMMARALHMGDELHNRPAAGTLLFASTILPHLLKVCSPNEVLEVTKYLSENDIFFLCMSMAACKAITKAAHGIQFSTIVTVMARNGTTFGIKVSGLGDDWFTGEANMIKGLYFPGYSHEDANPDIGDSAITETAGIGAFALAGSPAILALIGGSAEDAIKYTYEMRKITNSLNDTFTLPIINFQGTATGIDIRKVMRTGITPVIDTAIAHRHEGGGYIGAGLVRAPLDPFKNALHAYGRKYKLV